jgi:hypothetical protein
MKRMCKKSVLPLLILLLSLIPVQRARAGFFIGLSGANFAFSINSGLGVYQTPVYPGYLYCTNVFCYRWIGYEWYYAPWGGGPWVLAPATFLLPPPLIYGPPPPLVVVYRPYFVWWRGYVGPWYAIHHPVWWHEARPYMVHYNVWRAHVIHVYGPHVSAAIWTQPRALGMRPRFLPQGHPNIHWAQRQWARNRPNLYGRDAVRSFYRTHPAIYHRVLVQRASQGRFTPRRPMSIRGMRGPEIPPRRPYLQNRGYRAGPVGRPIQRYGRPIGPGMRERPPSYFHPRPYKIKPKIPRLNVARRCRYSRRCFSPEIYEKYINVFSHQVVR